MLSQVIPGAILGTLTAGANHAASQAIETAHGLNPLRPDAPRLWQATTVGLAAQTGLSTLASLGSHVALNKIGMEGHLASASVGTTAASIALTLGLVHCAGWAEERTVTHLLQRGLFNNPKKRDQLTPTGEALHLTLHHGFQFGAFLLGLSITGGAGFLGAGLGLAGQALLASVTWDAGKAFAKKLFPKTFAARAQRLAKQHEIAVYTGQPPLTLGTNAAETRRWKRLAGHLGEALMPSRQEIRMHRGKGHLRFSQNSQGPSGVRGFVLYATGLHSIGRGNSRDLESFLKASFTTSEREDRYVQNLKTLADPEERKRKLANWLEIKRSVWSFLRGVEPENDPDWNPHEIEIYPDAETRLARFRLSPRLRDLQDRKNIGEIRLTFTDEGHHCVGILNFRDKEYSGDILGVGIDLADARRWWRHEEGWWKLGNPKIFFPVDLYERLFGADKRPTAEQIAHRHATSEALFKALWPHHPQARHDMTLYREFGHTPPAEEWRPLELTGGMSMGLENMGGGKASVFLHQEGPSVLSFAIIRRPAP